MAVGWGGRRGRGGVRSRSGGVGVVVNVTLRVLGVTFLRWGCLRGGAREPCRERRLPDGAGPGAAPAGNGGFSGRAGGHPTTGGYPVVGVVRETALAGAAQAVPGTRVRFVRADR
ncbi:hypothetical protein ACFVT1_02675 [Streptomyces sp. NPDC057963]|uniref:hypothetical protein n=1 Tax=Streptomyces sp. NPDC057963 TaxID=3346290 RepID=UPI0036EDFD0E